MFIKSVPGRSGIIKYFTSADMAVYIYKNID